MILDREKVIRALYGCVNVQSEFTDAVYICPTCAYGSDDGRPCESLHLLLYDAYTLLKEQEPRVMTLGDLRNIGSVWELNTPPYLWMDINPSHRWTRGFWVAWREIFDMIDGLHPTYDSDNYGKIWRCWTAKPSLKQMEETPWN